MKISITKRFMFEAAHSLPETTGKCKNVHGHSYVLEVTVVGERKASGPENGMVMDFAELSRIVDQEIISKWDHQFLNDLLSFPTTAENLAVHIFETLSSKIPLESITLWETAKCFAKVSKS